MLTSYSGRLAELSLKGDDKLLEEGHKAISVGRRTVFELLFLEGLFASMSNMEGAITLLNTHIADMDARKVTQDEIEPSLWQFVSRVLRGERLM